MILFSYSVFDFGHGNNGFLLCRFSITAVLTFMLFSLPVQ